MIDQISATDYYLEMFILLTQYVWGMNYPTVIDRVSIEKAFKEYGSGTYTRQYYENKLKVGLGKPGSDCSGAHHGLSKYDTTAQGYYERCTEKGKISTMPKNKVCLLFVETVKKDKNTGKVISRKMTHTGVYLPNVNKAFHMKSSSANAVLENLSVRGWTHWGYADFISYNSNIPTFDFKEWVKSVQTILNKEYNSKLVVDGDFGPKTLSALPILRTGSKGDLVKKLQVMLNLYGYSGTVDGEYGNKTKKAVELLQRRYNKTDDGICGNQTWSVIQKLTK